MASNTTMIKKLQHALNTKGCKVLYNTSQFYSKQQDRPVTVYHLKQAIWDDEKQKNKNIDLFKSTSQIQIVLYLRDLWYSVNNLEIPTDNEMWNNIKANLKKSEQEVS